MGIKGRYIYLQIFGMLQGIQLSSSWPILTLVNIKWDVTLMPIMAWHVTLVCDIAGYELATHEASVDDLGLKDATAYEPRRILELSK